ncbi:quinone oxidoreductase family protein [Miltoncostaea marina]|uniref:quinone oxidoreductase family protein n=1 Tax=Miltoncostaea marina TaxID=2843215 RepID=UPI001C3CD1D1|nr:zinc-binding alcohol dehydrogenase family protein [Miltoncostaea marina]
MSIGAWGAPPEVGERPEPGRVAGRALVRVSRTSVNPLDLAIGAGRFYGPLPDLPYTPGAEAVGEVLASEAHAPGTRVWCLPVVGAMAEVVSVPEEWMVPVPEGVPDDLAVGLGIAGMAGWMSVLDRAALVPGETAVVLGAGGVVGQVAIQAARSAGAASVVAVSRAAAGRERALALGADVVVDGGVEDLAGAIAEACPDGADVVIDPVWGPPAIAAIRALRRRGRLVQVGNAAAPTAEVPAGALRGGLLDLRGFSLLIEDPERVRAAYSEIAAAALAGEVTMDVEVVPLDALPEAWARQSRGTGGRKTVVAVG